MTESIIKENNQIECSIAYFDNLDFKFVSGSTLKNLKIAFKTFGKLNKEKTNAILICHALTGDQYVTGHNPITNRDGWWTRMVGPEKPIDTNKFFVICSNVLGGCAGSTGPKEILCNGKAGYLFKIGDHLNLSKKIQNFKHSNNKMSKINFGFSQLHRFDYNKNLKKYLDSVENFLF